MPSGLGKSGVARMRLPGRWMLAALSALLVSCGGGGGGDAAQPEPGPPLPSRNYMPLAVGDRWIYQDGSTQHRTTVRVTSQQTVDGQTASVVEETDIVEGTSRMLMRQSSSGVVEFAGQGTDPLRESLGTLELMRYPVRIGQSWVQVDTTIPTGLDFDGDGVSDSTRLHSVVTIVGEESITTPAGTFAQSVHQRTTVTQTVTLSRTRTPIRFEIVGDEWLAPDIGMVHATTTVRGDAIPEEVATRTLQAYAVGGRRTENVPPLVLSAMPASGVTQNPGAVVSATFNETMDTTTLSTTTFTVLDGSGTPVDGRVQVDGNTARFIPTSPWTNGRHTARIGTGAQDQLGNPLAGDHAWTFDVDAAGPRVITSTPASGETNVPAWDPIVLRFSEALRPEVVNEYTFRLRTADGAFTATTTVTLDGTTVTIVPRGTLPRDQDYQLIVTGEVTDAAGNAVDPAYTLNFRVGPGLFLPPQGIAASFDTQAVAIGDVTGDGMADVVLTSGMSNLMDDRSNIFVLPGRADGSLGTPQRLLGPLDQLCWQTALVIGDLNGDGRQDLVSGGCGARVFHQTPAGTLVQVQFLDRADTSRLRLADLDGDGHLDLVGIGSGNVINIWRKNPVSGQFELGIAPTFTGQSRDLEVGDVNGDGRPDLIVVGSMGQDHVAVFRQQPDGTFAAPVLHRAGTFTFANGVAVGDLNGDGRTDVVVTGGENSPTSIGVLFQGSNGTLLPVTRLVSYDIPMAVRVADMNGDGRIDIVVSHQGWMAVGIYAQQADGTIAGEALYPGPYGNWLPNSLAVGDVTRDGRPDILIAGELLQQRALPPGSPLSALRPALRSQAAALRAASQRAVAVR